jgi:hypothetical protein
MPFVLEPEKEAPREARSHRFGRLFKADAPVKFCAILNHMPSATGVGLDQQNKNPDHHTTEKSTRSNPHSNQ